MAPETTNFMIYYCSIFNGNQCSNLGGNKQRSAFLREIYLPTRRRYLFAAKYLYMEKAIFHISIKLMWNIKAYKSM